MKSKKVDLEYKKTMIETYASEFICPGCGQSYIGKVAKEVLQIDFKCKCGEIFSVYPKGNKK